MLYWNKASLPMYKTSSCESHLLLASKI